MSEQDDVLEGEESPSFIEEVEETENAREETIEAGIEETGKPEPEKGSRIDKSEPEKVTKKPKSKAYKLIHPRCESDANCSLYLKTTQKEFSFEIKNGVYEFARDGKDFDGNDSERVLIATEIFETLISEGWIDETAYEYFTEDPPPSVKEQVAWIFRHYSDDDSTVGIYVGKGLEQREVSLKVKNNEIETDKKEIAQALEAQGFRIIRTK